jgi:hypothetical protein
LDGLDQHYERAEVDARRSDGGANVEIKTKNVSALVLTTPAAKKVVLDGQSFNVASQAELRFQKREGSWKEGDDGSLRKRHGLQGPIDDAFLTSFLCVRPTSPAANDKAGRYAEETLAAFQNDYAKYFRGQVPVKNDTAVTDADIKNSHLILFGDPDSNQVLKRVLGKLPVQWDSQNISLGGKQYKAANHTIVMIYPNPLNPDRYVVLNSGHSFHRNEMAATNATLFPRFGDYAILHLRPPIDEEVESEAVTVGYFDENWKVPGAT